MSPLPEPAARVMVIGGGSARDHALVRSLRRSPRVGRVIFVPGNSAVEHLEGVESAPVATQDLDGLVELAELEEVDLTVVGPNTPIIMGIVDRFRDRGLPIFGPGQAAARLEGSKVFSKNFMMRNQIPSARFAVFGDTERATHFCRRTPWARVIKTDKLAYEKGVEVCRSVDQCADAVQRIMVDEVLDEGTARVVIEERLEGPEVTLCVLSDGQDVVTLDVNSNYPRQLDFDQGPRTRGMGAVSPAPPVDAALLRELEETIAIPAVRGIQDFGPPLVGALFVDVIIQRGRPYVLDFNVRFGDPATQVMLARLRSDLFELLMACVEGRLGAYHDQIQLDPRPAVSLVLAADGYPMRRRRDDPVVFDPSGLGPDCTMDVGGMRWSSRDGLVTTGGRVATITALGDTLPDARAAVYDAVAAIQFAGRQYRTDIGASGGRM